MMMSIKKKCKCGNEPIYKNGELQLCSSCLGAIWTGRITLKEYLSKYKKAKEEQVHWFLINCRTTMLESTKHSHDIHEVLTLWKFQLNDHKDGIEYVKYFVSKSVQYKIQILNDAENIVNVIITNCKENIIVFNKNVELYDKYIKETNEFVTRIGILSDIIGEGLDSIGVLLPDYNDREYIGKHKLDIYK